MPVPASRDEAVVLLQKLGYDTAELSPEETEAIRRLYFLDDNRPFSVIMQAEHTGGEP